MNSLSGVMVVGLTGQTGAGKSTVTEVFKQAGFTVIDADRVSKFVQRRGSPCLYELQDYFTDAILLADGSLNRKKLAEIVFSDKTMLEVLNSICYPYINSEILRQIRRYARLQKKIILLDAPTLFESRTDDFCEIIISVTADEKLRFERIKKRDGLSDEEAENRMSSQHKQNFFEENSDFIIKNNSTVEKLNEIATEVADKIWDYYYKHYQD